MTPFRKRMTEALELRGMSPKTTRLYMIATLEASRVRAGTTRRLTQRLFHLVIADRISSIQ